MSATENQGTGPAQPSGKSKPPAEIVVKVSWCKGCGLCVEYCKRGVLEMEGVLPKVVLPDRCTRCMQCELICPDFAIEVHEPASNAGEAGSPKQ